MSARESHETVDLTKPADPSATWTSSTSGRRHRSDGFTGWLLAGACLVTLLTFLVPGIDAALCRNFPDDALFYNLIARNLLAGHGSTSDGLSQSNGYHPLWMLIVTATTVLPESWAMKAELGVLFLLNAGAAWLLYRWLAGLTDSTAALTVALLATFEQSVFQVTWSGMETALAWMILIALMHLLGHGSPDAMPPRRWWGLRLGLLLLMLARLDGGVFWIAVASMSVAGGPLRLSSLVQRLWRTGRFFLPPTLVVLAYLGFNRWWFGTAIPISGRIKSIPPLQLFSRSYDWTAAGRRVRGLMTPDFLERLQSFGEGLLPGASIIILLIFLGVVFAAVVFLMRARGSEFSLRTLTLFVALHIAYYALLQKDPYSLAWAKGPELLLTLVVMAFLLGHLLRLGKLRDRAAAWICITLVFSSGVYSHSRRLGDMTRVYDFSVSREDFDNAVQFIERSVPKNEPIMTWNIGFLGYYTGRPVVSYDGLLNSLAYFEQYQSKQRVADYMRERGIRYIANRIPLQGDPATLLAGQFSGLHPDDLEILAMFDRGRTQPKVQNRYVVARCHW